jgi:maltose O-acetyltransferase
MNEPDPSGAALTERERMLRGLLYLPYDPELVEERMRARRLVQAFNDSPSDDAEQRTRILGQLLGGCGQRVIIEPPFRCDYGTHITIGDDTFVNFNCVVLDCAAIRIGARVLIAPGVQILAATHPLDIATRRSGRELARPVTIGDDVWLGAGVIVNPGVTIGDGSVIGSGSVVVSDVPSNVVAVGNPCRVLRALPAAG